MDRKSNVIIFGLQEKSLVDTRKDVDTILHFLCGRTVPFNDAFRLGRFNADQITAPPRPLLVKLYSMWDRRVIVANKRSLKDFEIKRLFIREDLSPEERQERSQQWKERVANKPQRSKSLLHGSVDDDSESCPSNGNQ